MLFGMGFTEMVIIAGIALVFLGPEKFPDFAKIVMRSLRDIRGYMDDVKSEINNEIRPVQRELRELSRFEENDRRERWKTPASKAKAKAKAPAKDQEEPAPAADEVDAQNVVDPGVAEEKPPVNAYEYDPDPDFGIGAEDVETPGDEERASSSGQGKFGATSGND